MGGNPTWNELSGCRRQVLSCGLCVRLIINLMKPVLWFMSAYLTRLGGTTTRKFAAASTLLTVTTNIIVTGLIAFRLLRARRTLAKVLPSADLRLYTGVVAVLIESALPLSLFGIIAAILQQLDHNGYQVSEGFLACNALFIGLFYIFCVSFGSCVLL